ncbi:hypothetical protein, partial [Aetokthonos hydrillicola]|uniref:hypothetical protein n=1 Tax=Aetokthonos hydrillicola TaxID=1550245 RepID=UPI001ABAEFAA
VVFLYSGALRSRAKFFHIYLIIWSLTTYLASTRRTRLPKILLWGGDREYKLRLHNTRPLTVTIVNRLKL